MKKVTLFTIMVLCLALTACGTKEDEERQTPREVQNEVATNNSVPEETPEEVLEELTEEIENSVEEVIGDVDVAANELTMDDMTEQIIGLDIPVWTGEEGSEVAYEGKDFKVLFPNPMYITETHDNGVRANLETIDFVLSINTSFADVPTTVNTNRNQTMENIGNYTVVHSPGRDDKYGVQKSYHIYDTTNGTLTIVSIVINKKSEYQEYGDAFAEEFMPVFEEMLLSNLQ